MIEQPPSRKRGRPPKVEALRRKAEAEARGEPGVGLGNTDRWDVFERAGLDDLRADGESRTAFLLRFTLAHPEMDTTIVGTLIPDHLAENVRIAEQGPLPADVYAEAKRRLDARAAKQA